MFSHFNYIFAFFFGLIENKRTVKMEKEVKKQTQPNCIFVGYLNSLKK